MTYYTMKDLTERYSVHRNTIWRWIKTRGFPAGVAFSPTTRRFPVSEVQAWEFRRAENSTFKTNGYAQGCGVAQKP